MILLFFLALVGLILGTVGFLYQRKAINKLIKKEQPVDTKNIENKHLLKQILIGAGSMILGSVFLLIALILSLLPHNS
ncbi:hypothetical protein [Neobacillus massiliamazoniensis]|uniref:Uncharacterized protein n=1 Tax=Neobacillus massiliamazoniensis TaxID=1499688 RepID=A0A0U1P3F7_9BACI|nr:hypothetical protein [Neobacillus massiliamazoniensis]CRK84760.1 hypothetical protein BN000_04810 [Neobacillus massiliamazoniensis]